MTTDSPNRADPDACFARFRASGDAKALGDLFDATAPHLFRVALALAPDAAAAEDALQETFLFALSSAGRFEDGRPVVPWLVGILRMKSLEACRRVRRQPVAVRLATSVERDGEPDPLVALESDDDRRRLHAALDALPEPYRNVAILRWRYGLGPAEIAHARGEPPGTTASLLSRGVGRLRRAMKAVPAMFLGPRAPRGIDAVRADVIAAARATSTPAARAAPSLATAAVGGGLLVANIGWTAWIVAGALLVAGAWALHARSRANPEDGRRGAEAATEPRAESASASGDARPALAAHGVAGPPTPGISSPAPASSKFRGVVVDDRGKPAAGATIARTPDAPQGTAVVPEAFAIAGADGRFAADGPAGVDSILLRASGASLASVGAPAVARRGEEATIVVVASCAIRLTVTGNTENTGTTTGKPIGGAIAFAYPQSFSMLGAPPRSGATNVATTDAEGHATLRVAGGATRVLVKCDGWAPDEVFVSDPTPDGLDVAIALVRGGTLAGRVVTPAGAAVADALVVVGEGYEGYRLERRTAADGTFAVDHAPPRPTTPSMRPPAVPVRVEALGFPPLSAVVPLPDEGGRSDSELRLVRGRVVEVRVVRKDGSPVVGAPVGLSTGRAVQPFQWLGHGRTDGKGTWRSDAVPVGSATATASALGAAATSEATIVAGDGAQPLEVELDGPSTPLRVRVVDRDGKPVAGARVLAGAGGVGDLETDADGRLAITARSTLATSLFVDSDRGPIHDVSIDPKRGSDGADGEALVTIDGDDATARVERLDGSPAAATFTLIRQISSGKGKGVRILPGTRYRVQAGADGALVVRNTPPGWFLLDLDTPGLVIVDGPVNPPMEAGGRGLRIRVATPAEDAATRRAIELEWIDADSGKPIEARPEARLVSAADGSPQPLSTPFPAVASDRGTRFLPVRCASYALLLRGGDYEESRVELTLVPGAGPQTVRVESRRGGSAAVTVRDGSGATIERGVTVTAADRSVSRPGADHSFVIEGLAPGAAQVTVRAPFAEPVTRSVTLVRGETARLDVVLAVASAVEVRPKPGLSRSAAVSVVLTPTGGGGPRRLDVGYEPKEAGPFTTLERRAEWTLSVLRPGRYRVEATWDGVALPSSEIEARAGVVEVLELGPP